jgi:hypothetical protein
MISARSPDQIQRRALDMLGGQTEVFEQELRRASWSEYIGHTKNAHWSRVMKRQDFCNCATEPSGGECFFSGYDTARLSRCVNDGV